VAGSLSEDARSGVSLRALAARSSACCALSGTQGAGSGSALGVSSVPATNVHGTEPVGCVAALFEDVVDRERAVLECQQRDVRTGAVSQRPELVGGADQRCGRSRRRFDRRLERHAEREQLREACRQVEHRAVDAELVRVGRDHRRANARLEQRLGGGEREAAGAVPEVEHHAAPHGAQGGVKHAAVAHQCHRRRRGAVGHDVARS
jgi:hypothetical protein